MIIISGSCATFPESSNKQHLINKENVQSLNGIYSLTEISRSSLVDSSSFAFSETDLGFKHTFYDELSRGMFSRRMVMDSLKVYHFVLNVLNDTTIEIDYLENGISFIKKQVSYKLKDDGYAYLKNGNFKIRGIPYLFGSIDVKKIRLTLNNEQDLLFETSEFSSGGVALLMVYPIGKMKYQKIYQRK